MFQVRTLANERILKRNKNGWTEVMDKKRKKKPKGQACSKTIVISSKGNPSDAEIQKDKKTKTDSEPTDLDQILSKIRRT